MKSPEQHSARRLRSQLLKSFPGSDKILMSQIMATAHEIATERTGNAKFDVNVVASVIRWSRKEIRSAIAAKVEYSRDAFFRPEQARPSRNPNLDFEPDGCNYLMSNESWSGKGISGKNNFSAVE